MLDTLMGHYARHRFNNFDEGYSPEKAIQYSTLYNENGAILTVLFPPWRGGEGAYDRLTKRLIKNGSAVLRYKLHPQILEPNADRVLASFNYIQKTVINELEAIGQLRVYDEINLIGASLGTVSLCYVAKAFPKFNRATLVVPGSNLARCAWDGSRTQAIRKDFEAQNINDDALDKLWENIAPKLAASSFQGKKVTMVISTTDTIIPTSYQEEMLSEVLHFVPNLDVHRTNLGHIASVTKFCISGSL